MPDLTPLRFFLAAVAGFVNREQARAIACGRTPVETYRRSESASATIELRQRWPIAGDRVERPGRPQLLVKFLDDRRHLPIIELRQAA